MKEAVVGVGYYKREQWNLLLESASDREDLEARAQFIAHLATKQGIEYSES